MYPISATAPTLQLTMTKTMTETNEQTNGRRIISNIVSQWSLFTPTKSLVRPQAARRGGMIALVPASILEINAENFPIQEHHARTGSYFLCDFQVLERNSLASSRPPGWAAALLRLQNMAFIMACGRPNKNPSSILDRDTLHIKGDDTYDADTYKLPCRCRSFFDLRSLRTAKKSSEQQCKRGMASSPEDKNDLSQDDPGLRAQYLARGDYKDPTVVSQSSTRLLST